MKERKKWISSCDKKKRKRKSWKYKRKIL